MTLIPLRDRNPTERFPVVTVGLIALNVFVYVATARGILVGPTTEAVLRYGAIPCDILGSCEHASGQLVEVFPGRSPLVTVLTSMFMHGDFFHILGNMLFLWVFGNNIEDRLGRIAFIVFYLVSGVAATATHFALNTGSQVPVVGASGAISGVLGAYLVLYPRARVLSLVPLGFFFFTVEVPAAVLLVLWFGIQLFQGFAGGGLSPGGGGVAVFAHIGGFAAGWLMIRVFPKRRTRRVGPEGWFRT